MPTFTKLIPKISSPSSASPSRKESSPPGPSVPLGRIPTCPILPLWHYKWDKTYEALQNLAQVDASPFDDVAMEFSDPATGGPVLRTMTCWAQLIRPGINTRAHRQTSCAVYQVYKGEGYSVIDGQRFDWSEGDFFVVPPWAWHEHANDSTEEAILFSIQDNNRPIHELAPTRAK